MLAVDKTFCVWYFFPIPQPKIGRKKKEKKTETEEIILGQNKISERNMWMRLSISLSKE